MSSTQLRSGGGLNNPFAPAAPIVPVPVPVREEGYGIPVFWTGDHVHSERLDGFLYHFQPQTTTPVYATYRHQVDEKTGKAMLDRDLEVRLTADEIVKGLIQKAGSKGLIVLTGTPKDEQKKREGRALYTKWRLAECNRIISLHEMSCQMATKFNAIPPRPSAAWRLAKHDLQRLHYVADDRKRFLVIKDGMDFDTMGQAKAYVESAYPGTLPQTIIRDQRPNDPQPPEKELEGDPLDIAEVAPVAAAPINQTTDLQEEVTAIFLRAGIEGITLPQEIRDGLKSDEGDIVRVAIDEAKRLIDGPDGTAN